MAPGNKEPTKSIFRQPNIPPSRQLMRLALVFIAGLLLGWFVLGWWLFPIEYTQVYPNELRPEARDEYFQMVAEGYALTGDRIRAAQRLQYWNVDNELQRVINARILALESSDPAAAEPLRRLAEDLHLTQTTALPQTSGQSPGGASGDIGRTVLYLLGGVLVLVLLYVAYKRWLQPRMAAPASRPPTPEPALPPGGDTTEWAIDGDFEAIETLDDEPLPAVSPPSPQADRFTEAGREQAYPPEIRETVHQPEMEEPGGAAGEVVVPPPVIPPTPTSPPQASTPTEMGAAGAAREPEKSGYLFEGVIRFEGQPTFNELHRLGEANDYQGEVGLGAGEGIQDEHVKTLEVWLFDKADIQTKAVVLIPLDAYEDEEMRLRLAAGSSDVAPLQPGEKIRLQTRTFVAEGEVRRVDFGPVVGGAPSIHYAELLLRVRRTKADEMDESASRL